MTEIVGEYYIDPEKMTVSFAHSEAEKRMADDDLEEYGLEEENTVQPEQLNHASDTGEDNIIVIEE